MNGNDILKLGYPRGVAIGLALKAAQVAKASHVNKRTILEELASVLATPEEMLQRIMFDVDAFVGNTPQHDDITCLLVKVG